MEKKELKVIPFIIAVCIGASFWILPKPDEVTAQAWHMVGIFLATIFSLITSPLPMGASALVALTALVATKTLPFVKAFDSFGSPVIWLVLVAFFIAKGFSVTGLGSRIAYLFVYFFGKKTLSLAYGMLLSDLMLAPGIPSATARAGGFMFPIIRSLAGSFDSHPNTPSARKIGAFLILNTFQGTVITSCMFVTAMAANPLIVSLAERLGVEITWGGWFLGAVVPGLICLALIPLVLFLIYPPEIRETPQARQFAEDELKKMGPMKGGEWVMLGTFFLLLILWIFGKSIGMDATTAALIGLSLLLISGVLKWDELLKMTSVWETMVWFAALVTMAGQLTELGFTNYLTNNILQWIIGMNWLTSFVLLCLFYFYSHYLFASSTAHVGSMYGSFLALSLSLGVPKYFAALFLAYLSNLFGGITHYSLSPAPLLFGAGYVPIKTWWGIGFIFSVIYLVIFATVGTLWLQFLGV